MGVPINVIKLVKITMGNTSAKVKIGNKFSKSFLFSAGVKQGDGLSTTLFNIVLNSAINKTDQRGTLFVKYSRIYAYVGDLVIVTRHVNILKQVYLESEREFQGNELSVKERKKKDMIILTCKVRGGHRIC
jgi:hypothetical protein